MKRIPVIMIASLFVIGIPAITQSDPVPKKNGNTLFRCGVWHMEEIKGNPKSQEAYKTSKQV